MQLQMSEQMVGAGRQLVPGLLLMSDGTTHIPYTQQPATQQQQTSQQQRPAEGGLVNVQTTATIAKELLKNGVSPTAEAIAKNIPAMMGPHGDNNSVIKQHAMANHHTQQAVPNGVMHPKDL